MGGLDRIFVALDGMNDVEACQFVAKHGCLTHCKVGLELFFRYGRQLVGHMAREYGRKIFLDVKIHDIPQTAERALRALEGLDIEFLSLHLSGGEAMVRRMVEVRDDYFPGLQLLGVTHLTSLARGEAAGDGGVTGNSVAAMAQRAGAWGVDGVICPATELKHLSSLNMLKVCPGIRFPGEDGHDQKQVMSPRDAFSAGADYLVMGRSLTQTRHIEQRMAELVELSAKSSKGG